MSTMSEGDPAGQGSGIQHDTPPSAPPQAGAPAQEQAYGQVPAQAPGPQPPAQPPMQPGMRQDQAVPVARAETRVTGRRVAQYLIDSFLVALVPSLVSIPFDHSTSTFMHVLGGIVAFVLFALIGFLYWVFFPHRFGGQTVAMKMLGLRVISKGGGRANPAQLFVRWICLIVDAIPYAWPFTGLVGFIIMLCSRDRQRLGDHLGRTLVIATDASRGRHTR